MWEERKRRCRAETCALTLTECCTLSSKLPKEKKNQPVNVTV